MDQDLTALAPGSVVVVRDEEATTGKIEPTFDELLIFVHGAGEFVQLAKATYYKALDRIEVLDPASARVTAEDSARSRTARISLEVTLRKTAIPLTDPASANLARKSCSQTPGDLGRTLGIAMILTEGECPRGKRQQGVECLFEYHLADAFVRLGGEATCSCAAPSNS